MVSDHLVNVIVGGVIIESLSDVFVVEFVEEVVREKEEAVIDHEGPGVRVLLGAVGEEESAHNHNNKVEWCQYLSLLILLGSRVYYFFII